MIRTGAIATRQGARLVFVLLAAGWAVVAEAQLTRGGRFEQWLDLRVVSRRRREERRRAEL